MLLSELPDSVITDKSKKFTTYFNSVHVFRDFSSLCFVEMTNALLLVSILKLNLGDVVEIKSEIILTTILLLIIDLV